MEAVKAAWEPCQTMPPATRTARGPAANRAILRVREEGVFMGETFAVRPNLILLPGLSSESMNGVPLVPKQ